MVLRRSPNNVRLTKAYVESKVSQELIVSKYLNIPLEIVNNCIETNTLIESVFRDDDCNCSMGIQYNKAGKLKVRDFGGFGFFDDIYGVVAYVLSLLYERKIETNNKQDFYFILKHIAYTFQDIFNNKEVDPSLDNAIKSALIKGKSKKAIIEIVPRSWNSDDKSIWGKWGVSLSYLNTHFVIPVEQYYINRNADSDPKYYYSKKDPCYAYMLGQNRQGIYLIKLYFPRRNRNVNLKFITNCNVLEGLPNLELDDYDYILITKSSKDRLSIGNAINNLLYGGVLRDLKIGIINLPSENYKLKDKEYVWLKNKLSEDGRIISLLDFDRTGRIGADYLRSNYDIPFIFITRGELNLPDYEAKDFAELCEKYDSKEISQFIKETIEYVEIKYKNLSNSDAYYKRLSDFDLPY